MSSIAEKIESSMAELQAAVTKYNETVAQLEKIKEELFKLQGAVNALKELQEVETETEEQVP
jgi:exonuclease VII small subunit